MKVCVLQTDNRPSLDYLLKTKEVNQKFCDILQYDYLFLNLENDKHLHPATKKIHVVNDFLQRGNYDILVFLDSDAWIQNGYWLNTVLTNLEKSEKHGCFSRDPYLKINTYVNSGSFILKINDYTKNMYKTIIRDLNENSKYHTSWPYDQYYVSKYVFENKDDFVVFLPDILNTPLGKVLRHNWRKNHKMYHDLAKLLFDIEHSYINKSLFQEKDYYDIYKFPNIDITGYEYDC